MEKQLFRKRPIVVLIDVLRHGGPQARSFLKYQQVSEVQTARHSCTLCKTVHQSKDELSAHVVNYHGTTCRICGKFYGKHQGHRLSKHWKKHLLANPVEDDEGKVEHDSRKVLSNAETTISNAEPSSSQGSAKESENTASSSQEMSEDLTKCSSMVCLELPSSWNEEGDEPENQLNDQGLRDTSGEVSNGVQAESSNSVVATNVSNTNVVTPFNDNKCQVMETIPTTSQHIDKLPESSQLAVTTVSPSATSNQAIEQKNRTTPPCDVVTCTEQKITENSSRPLQTSHTVHHYSTKNSPQCSSQSAGISSLIVIQDVFPSKKVLKKSLYSPVCTRSDVIDLTNGEGNNSTSCKTRCSTTSSHRVSSVFNTPLQLPNSCSASTVSTTVYQLQPITTSISSTRETTPSVAQPNTVLCSLCNCRISADKFAMRAHYLVNHKEKVLERLRNREKLQRLQSLKQTNGNTLTSPSLIVTLACTSCSFKTTNRSQLTEHIATMHSIILKACEQCDYTSLFDDDLLKHKEAYHPLLHCKLCKKAASSNVELADHMDSHHYFRS